MRHVRALRRSSDEPAVARDRVVERSPLGAEPPDDLGDSRGRRACQALVLQPLAALSSRCSIT
jgi:hypothetical protein